jgi:hypothetical protein
MTENTQTIIWTNGIWTNGKKAALAGIIAIWFAAAAYIGAAHLLQNTGADLFAPISRLQPLSRWWRSWPST